MTLGCEDIKARPRVRCFLVPSRVLGSDYDQLPLLAFILILKHIKWKGHAKLLP